MSRAPIAWKLTMIVKSEFKISRDAVGTSEVQENWGKKHIEALGAMVMAYYYKEND